MKVSQKIAVPLCVHLDIEQIFTTHDNPRGNADTERVIRTLKEEAVWPYENETPMAAETKLREAVEFYNTVYCHSSLGYMSPAEFAAAFFSNVGKTTVGINGEENNAPGFDMNNDLGSDEGDGPPLSSRITTTAVAA